MNVEQWLTASWRAYVGITPQVEPFCEQLKQRGDAWITDHIALRTFGLKGIGCSEIIEVLKAYGYRVGGQYHFQEKALRSFHLEPANMALPLVFISELIVEEMPQKVQEVLQAHLKPDLNIIGVEQLCFWKPWSTPGKALIHEVSEHSEFAAWLLCHGLRVNHFALRVHELSSFNRLEDLNAFLKTNGYILNTSGGEIKGGVAHRLRQSSVMAQDVGVSSPRGDFKFPGGYMEFAERDIDESGQRFMGFLGPSANRIFESTHRGV